MRKQNEPTLQKTTIFEGRVIDLELHDVELENGARGQREVVKHPGAVAIVGLTPEWRIPLVRQYRKAPEEFLLEIPAGKKEGGESPEATAHREFAEETGYKAGHLEEIAGFYTSPGFADEFIHVFLATKLTPGNADLDEDEFLHMEEWSLETAKAQIKRGNIRDAKTAFALQALFSKYPTL